MSQKLAELSEALGSVPGRVTNMTHPWGLTIVCNSRHRGSNAVFSPPQAPGRHTQDVNIYMQAKHTHIESK